MRLMFSRIHGVLRVRVAVPDGNQASTTDPTEMVLAWVMVCVWKGQERRGGR